MKPKMSIVLLFLYLLPFTTINFSFSNGRTCIESERQALLRLKQDLNDPSNRLASWSSDGDCCTWAGVVCDNFTGHVLEVHLENPFDPYAGYVSDYEAFLSSELGGKINPSLLDLKDLIYLNLSRNDFAGIQIPRFLGSMGKLRYLDLSLAGFSGMIPYQLGNLSNLRYLNLGRDYSDGYYGDNLSWLSGLSLLEYLDLSHVNLNETSESLLALNGLPVLQVLILSHCQLDHFPPLSIANFSSLTKLDLSYNQLGNSIPSWIFGLSDLLFLSLFENNFQGPIPDRLQNLTSLRHLDLSYNLFNSSILDWLYKFSHLEYFSLSMLGKFETKISKSWGRLCNLRSINLSGVKLNQKISEVLDIFSGCVSNRLESLDLRSAQLFGDMTNQLGNFKNLVSLYLMENSISGHLPLSLGELLSLKYLYLSYNKLTGTISEIHFANLTRLIDFDIVENSLTLKVGHDWIPPFQVESLFLSSCYLGPQFPQWLPSQRNLQSLDISNSGIFDTISSRFWNFFSQISFLNLSHNKIHGEIPNLPETMRLGFLDLSFNNLSGPLPIVSSYIEQLELSNNNLSGSIFHFLCQGMNQSKEMQILNLKDNFFSGELPDCWMNWQDLEILNLDNNKFIGSFPNSMGTLRNLQSLHLSKNSLSGTIPNSLKTSNLEVLDLGENKFVGKIPTWIGERFPRMVILKLRSNKFHGVLPIELCRLSSLQVLDLANNNLSGTIPNCLNNFSAMVKMEHSIQNDIQYSFDYSYFDEDVSLMIKGKMVEYSTILNLVRNIDLSNNNFFGGIPVEVTKLAALQSLNLSCNFLTGRIPTTIGGMRNIESIDFSANRLSGEIPSSISNLTFLNYLNLSNNNLTGKIPLSTQLQSFNASSFAGNDLCRSPLPNNCTTTLLVPQLEGGKDGDEDEVVWFYVGMALGFVIGFCSVIGPLLINRRWRFLYCRFLDGLGNIFCCFVRK